MIELIDQKNLIPALERHALRNVVLLKHLLMYPESTAGYGVFHGDNEAFLVVLNASASAYDRETYPAAKHIAFINSDHLSLTRHLLDFLPCDSNIVFKLASEEDREIVGMRFPLRQTAIFHSFTSEVAFARDCDVAVDCSPIEALLALAESQGQEREWVQHLLSTGRAFFCSIGHAGAPASFCLAFENHKSVWEVGSVLTLEPYRGRGLAERVVKTAHAVLAERRLLSRYQVQGENTASISLAKKIGLKQFLTLQHYSTFP